MAVSERTTIGLLLYLEFFEDDVRRHGDQAAPRTGFAVPVSRLTSFTQPNSEMFSQFVRRTNTVLRAHSFIPWLPPSLGASQFSLIFRNHSWSSQPQAANWSHLNDIYSSGAVDVKTTKEHSSSPDERWAAQSRSRMATLTPPKGPYAGKTVVSFKAPRLSHISVQEGASR